MANVNTESIGAVRDQAAQFIQSIIEQATSRAMDEARASRKKAGRFTRSARSQAPPSVREIALNAASGAIELWQAARERAGETVETVQHTVAESASDLVHGAEGIKDQAVGRARSASEEAVDVVKSVGHVVGDSAHKAADTSKSAAAGTAKTGRNTLGLTFWSAVAGAVIYYAFLNEQRREQARHLAMRAINEGRALLRDLQGHDGEFTS